MNDFKLKLQAILDRVKSLANIRKDIQAIEAKLPKIKIKGTLNSTETRKELNSKIKNVRPKVKVDADTTAAVKKIKRLGQQKTNPKVAPTVDNTQVISSLKDTQKETKTLFDRFINGMIGVNLVRMAVQKVISAIHEAISSAKELDKIKTDIQMVSRTSDSEVNAMMSSYNSMAKDLSSTTKSVSEAANEFLRMGESVEATNKLIESSQILSKTGMINSSDAASYLISSLKGYKIAAEDSIDVVSKLTAVDLEAAISAGGLAEALSRTSNVANNSGTSMDRLIGYAATIGEVTQESMSVVGNSLRSIYSRMGNIKIGKFTDDETGESLSDTEAVLNKLGIKLRDTADTYRDFDDVLDDIGERWTSFNQIERNALSTAIAGSYQRERFTVLMNNYASALEYAGVAANSAGSALERYEVYQDSVEAKTNELTAAIESLSMNTLSEEMFSGIIAATTNLVAFIDKMGILKGTLAGLATMGISKMFVSMATGFITASKSAAQLTSVMAMFNMGKSADNLNDIGKACMGLSNNQLRLVLSTKGLINEDRLLILEGMGVEEQERRQTLATLGFASAEDKATASTISFKGALNTLKTAIISNPIGAAVVTLTTVVAAISMYKQHLENTKQKIEETANTHKQAMETLASHQKTVDELSEAYDKLSKGVDVDTNQNLSLSDEDYQSYINTIKELVDIFPSLQTGLDENGNAILSLGKNGRIASEDLRELLKAEEELNNYKISQDIALLFANVKETVDEAVEATAKFEEVSSNMEKAKQVLTELSEEGIDLSNGAVKISGDTADEAGIAYYNAIVKSIQNFKERLSNDRQIELSDILDLSKITDTDENGKFDIYLDTFLLSEEEKKQLQNEIKIQTSEMMPVVNDALEEAFQKQETAKKAAELAWKDYVPYIVATMKSSGSFKELANEAFGEDIQNFAIDLVSGLDQSVSQEMDKRDPYAWVRENIIASLIMLDENGRKTVLDAYNKLMELNPNDLAENNQDKIDAFVKIIAERLGQTEAEIRLNLGFEIDEDLQAKYDTAVESAASKFASSKKEIQSLFTELGIDTSSEIDKWNEITSSVNNATEAKKRYMETDISESAPKWDFSTTLENLNKVKESLNVLDKSFAKLFDKDESIGFEDLSSINEAFKDLEGIDDYIKRIQEAGQNTEEISQIFGELTGAYLEHAGVLSNVTEENKELVIQMLEEMGIANAEEIVLAQLSAQHEVLALQKQFLAQAGHELTEATIDEINQFLAESDASDIAKQSLAQLALEKIDLSNIRLDESGNISQLISLANAAGASAVAVAKAQNAINTINTMNAKGANGSAGDFHRLDNATLTVNQIKNNTYDWQYEKLDPNDFIVTNSPKYTPQYKGGSSTNKAIEQAKKDAEKEAKKAAKEAEKEFEKEVDFFERRVQVLSNAFSNLEKGMENVFGADAKNSLVTAQIGIVDEEINNYTDALAMYRQKANEALSGVSSDLRDKIKDGAVQITDFVGDGNEEVVEAMEAYEGWADKVADCTQKLEELKTQIRQLELQKFNNIVEDFTNQFDIHGDAVDLIDKQIGLLEEAGQLIGESFYTKQIEQSKKQLNTLEAEKTELLEQMNDALISGRIQKGTDEWLEMVNALSDVEGNILDCKTAIEEFDNELLNLNWQIFERVQTEFGNISSELNNLAGLFDDFNEIKVSDGKGTWTKEAIATLGLYAQQYELARHQVGQYGEAIDKLNQDYAAGRYSATEYADKLADLVKGQWDAVNSAESLEDAIYDLNKTRVDEEIKTIEDEIDAYKKLTDTQIDALDAAQSLHEYEQSIAEKTKAVTDIERQLAAMQNDNTSATVAKRKQLEEQLAEAKKALTDEEYNHSIEAQKDALNQQYTAFEEERNKEIESLQLTLEDRETLIANSLETVKANASTVGEQIAMIAQEHGVIVSDAIISSWKSGENAIASYGEVLSSGTSAFIGNIMGVQEYVYGLQAQANSTADSLSWMFSTRADNLVNELVSSYYSEANLNAMTNTLQNSLINTLERGYDVSSITSALSSIASGADSVASAANKAAQALANMGAAQTGAGTDSGSDSGSGNKGYKVVDTKYGRTIRTYSTKQEADDYIRSNKSTSKYFTVMKAAKGGIVTKDKNNPLNRIAESVGEDTMIAAKDGEGVLTRRQTDGLLNLTPMLEELNRTWNVGSITRNTLPEMIKGIDRPNVNVRYDKMFEFNGDFNNSEQLLNQMQKVAKGTTTKMLNDINRDFVIHCR